MKYLKEELNDDIVKKALKFLNKPENITLLKNKEFGKFYDVVTNCLSSATTTLVTLILNKKLNIRIEDILYGPNNSILDHIPSNFCYMRTDLENLFFR